MTLALVLSLASAHAQALPKGGQYVAGSGAIASSGPAMTVTQSSMHGVINWQAFSIGSANKVWFNNGKGATLNRVMGGNLSQIDGLLSATGSVYLINPNGLVVGPGGKIITGGSFIGSTLGISNQQFMQGGTLDFSNGIGDPNGAVINNGKIVSQNGNVALVGYSASNLGNILAPGGTVAVAAGTQVLLRPINGPAGIYVAPGASGDATNSGRIKAAAASLESAGGNVYELAGNQSGLISATGTQTINGQVWLTAPAGTVKVSGTVEAENANGSGGGIVAKGQSLVLSASSSLNAAGGGQIETSGESVSLGGKVSAGQGGTWTIDPTDLTIDSTAATTIDGDLASGNVTLQTTASGASGPGIQNASGVGDININSALSWSANTTLTLDAYHGVTINSPIASTGSSAGLTIKTNDGGSGGNFTVNSPVSLANSASLTINGNAYTLINSESGLEGMSSSGYIALNSDITLDSSYSVYSSFGGKLEGLGHTISGLSINNSSGSNLGLFNAITGAVENLNVSGNITASANAGILAHINQGTIYNVQTSGSVTAESGFGGMVGENQGTIANSSSSATLTITPNGYMGSSIGGLIGYNTGSVTNSSGTGSIGISNSANNLSSVGGLIGDNTGPVTNSYSTENITLGQYEYSTGGLIGYDQGTVTGSYSTGSITLGNYNWYTGGLIGEEFEATISDSYSTANINAGTRSYYTGGFLGQADYSSTIQRGYSTGAVTASGSYIGGFVGGTTGGGGYGYPTFTSDYWDTTTSGQATSAGGSGVTTPALEAALPTGFSSSVWSNLSNQATPYLLNNPGPVYVGSLLSTLIFNMTELQAVNNNLSGNYALASSLNASGVTGFTPIGESTAFTGTFNGLGNTISNLTINTNVGNAGLFGQIGSGGVVENLGLVGGSVTSTATYGSVGGLAGNNSGTVTNSYATGAVTGAGYDDVGGLIGYTGGGSITNAYATGATSAGNSGTVGGLVGSNRGTITDAYATGATSAGSNSQVGGLIGYTSSGSITNAYATGAPSAGSSSAVGGLVGAIGTGTITDAYWNQDRSGTTTGVGSGSSTGVTGLSGSSPFTASSYTGFTFTSTPGAQGNNWVIVDTNGTLNNASGAAGGTMPMLASEYSTTISNAHQLQLMAMAPSASYTLAMDINASATGSSTSTATGTDVWGSSGFIPVGQSTAFTGTFNGLGNTISNLTINTSVTNAGLFGQVGSGGVVENIGLVGGSVTNSAINSYVGGLAGNNDGTITNASTTGAVTGVNGNYAGGLVGFNQSAITDAYATGAVSGGDDSVVGGLTGYNNGGTISNSYATGALTAGTNSYVGGLAGFSNGAITNTYAAGAATGGSGNYVGGLVGFNNGTISGAYAIGAVSGGSEIGGLVGFNLHAITGSYWDTTTTTTTTGVGFGSASGTTGLTTGEWLTQGPIATANWSTSTWVSGYPYPVLKALPYVLITATGAQTYGSSTPGATISSITDQNGNDVTSLVNTSNIAWIGSASTTSNVGSGPYLLGGTGATVSTGYQLTYTGSLTVNPAALTITASNASKTYGSAATLTGFTTSGLVNSDTVGGVTLASTGAAATANAGNYPITPSGATGSGLSNYTITYDNGTLAVNPAMLTAALTGTISKTYDGTTAATLAPGNYTLSGVIGSDQVTLNDPASGSYTSQNVGSSIGVTVSGLTLGGASAGNYTLASATAAGNIGTITPASLTAGLTGTISKTYDGTTAATLTPGNYTLTGVIGSGQVTLNDPASGTYASPNAGTGIAVTASGLALSGAAAGNYTLASTSVNANIGTITPASLTAGLTGTVSKTYDGTAAATLAPGNYTLSGVIGSDQVMLNNPSSGSYASQNAGTRIGVAVSGLALSGASAVNYTLASTSVNANIGTITPASLTAGLTGSVSKTYDGTTTATLAPGNYTLSGVIGSDQVTLNNPSSGSYSNQNVGAGITVTASGLTLGGTSAGNYTLASATAAGNIGTITPASLTAGLTGSVSKTYDGNNTATLAPNNYTLSGVIGSDQVTLNDPTSGTYGTVQAGGGIPVTVTGLSLFGADAGNYTLASTSITANLGVIKSVVTPQLTLLPFITTLPTPVPAGGAGSLVLVGASNGFGPIPLILFPSNTTGTMFTANGVSLSTGLSLTVDPEQTLNQTGGVRHLNINLSSASGSGNPGGQQ